MKEFFMKFFVKGVKIILIVVAIWIVYYILNFINPTLFDFLRTSRPSPVATSSAPVNQSLGYKIYNMFFKSRATSTKEVSSSTRRNIVQDFWNSSSTVVWGSSSQSTFGGGASGSQNDLEGMTFVSPNTQNSPIANMKINALLINPNNFNYLPNGGAISGSIHTGFLSGYYFNAEIYDGNGKFLFSIPITSNHDLNTDSFANFYGEYNKNLNYTNYTGEGFMVIKSDNQGVSGSVLIKIILK